MSAAGRSRLVIHNRPLKRDVESPARETGFGSSQGDSVTSVPDTAQKADETFKPAWWLPSAHLQTLWPALLRRPPNLPLRRERLELPDGDFLDLDWAQESGRDLVVLIHGLEGSSRSSYMLGMMAALRARGWNVVAMNLRGCSGEHNRLDRSYHSGETGDLEFVVRHLAAHHEGERMAAVGYSLGGNALLKWLGESGAGCPLSAAVAISVPFRLERAAERMTRGLSRLYQWRLINALRSKFRDKYRAREAPIDLSRLDDWNDFRSFDEHVTAPLHGFAGADDYYARSSSRGYLNAVRTPTLIIHARDDPFMFADVVPEADEVSSAVRLEVSEHGGHVGFVAGGNPLRPRYWLETRVPSFLGEHLHANPGRAEKKREA